MKEFFTGRVNHELWPILKSYRYAHRGLHNNADIPENSLIAFQKAEERGFGAELDVHLLKDGTLAVFHDSKLERMTGASGCIEDLTKEELAKLRLKNSDCPIPLFDEVLDIFEEKTPLIIELKPERGNAKELARLVLERLDSYKGLFCIESFDPRAISAVRKMRPHICRGQLAMDFTKDPGTLNKTLARCLANLMLDVLSKPDFVAYRFEDRKKKSFVKAKKKGIQGVTWTIRSKEDMLATEAEGNIPIFELFDPEN